MYTQKCFTSPGLQTSFMVIPDGIYAKTKQHSAAMKAVNKAPADSWAGRCPSCCLLACCWFYVSA